VQEVVDCSSLVQLLSARSFELDAVRAPLPFVVEALGRPIRLRVRVGCRQLFCSYSGRLLPVLSLSAPSPILQDL
jgi:hypothetical protein